MRSKQAIENRLREREYLLKRVGDRPKTALYDFTYAEIMTLKWVLRIEEYKDKKHSDVLLIESENGV